jgi:nicotinic acid mononucleotide adenylyltransferase
MCHLAVDTTYGTRFPIKVCDAEVFEEQALNSFVLMEKLEKKHPDVKFLFACGSDLIPSLRTWPPLNPATGNSSM